MTEPVDATEQGISVQEAPGLLRQSRHASRAGLIRFGYCSWVSSVESPQGGEGPQEGADGAGVSASADGGPS